MVDIPNEKLPRHVGIIMDGNGRWAQSRKLPRVSGHREGAKAVNRVVTHCRERGIKVLTLFAFSSQNWVRPTIEVQALMALLTHYVNTERTTIMENRIRLTTIGDIDSLPDVPRSALLRLIEDSSGNTEMTLCLALSYGGRDELVSGARSIARRCSSGELDWASVDEKVFGDSLWSSDLGDLDLLIRTSGELRISNFMLWSAAYAEFFFCDRMWPDFGEADLEEAFAAFGRRNRRFGDVKEK
jgi:undecaprenyl diphosphate synthase